MRVQVAPDFFAGASDLRQAFENRVGPARAGATERFIWDYWYIPDQYTYFRTPALNVIAPSLLGKFTTALRAWGRTHLGTDRVTAPWLSFYTDGCRQELHSDVVQGIWSYVYSLTEWENRVFRGGETLLGTDRLLEYWIRFDPQRSTEARHLVERVPAEFNQLCVFDSRLPHGVAMVEGTRDPLKARVALHGWFHDPELALKGALELESARETIDGLTAGWDRGRSASGPLRGKAVWRVGIGPNGVVTSVDFVVDNLIGSGVPVEARQELLEATEASIRQARFPASDGPSELLLPLGQT